jgi:hypothetical protein
MYHMLQHGQLGILLTVCIYNIIFQHPVALVSSIYVCISPSQLQLLFSLVSYVYIGSYFSTTCFGCSPSSGTLYLFIYLLAETAALLCFVFSCPLSCLFNTG